MRRHHHHLVFILLLFYFSGCKKDDPTAPLSITAFIFRSADNPGLSADVQTVIQHDTILALFPMKTVIDKLVPTIDFSGENITPANQSVQDFTKPVHYKINGANGTSRTYVVYANVVADTSKSILLFTFKKTINPTLTADVTGVVKGDSILITMPFGTDLSKLIPSITMTGQTVSPNNETVQNFNSVVAYIVKAFDGSLKKYSVKVELEPSDGTVFFATTTPMATPKQGVGKIYALDTKTGVLKWKYEINNAQPNISSLAYANKLLYFTSNKSLFALNTDSHQISWEYITNGYISSTPVVEDGVIYVNSGDGFLYAVNAVNGSLIWKFGHGLDPWANGSTGTTGYSCPAIVDGVLYFGGNTGNFVYALDAATGTQKWKFQDSTVSPTTIAANPCVANGTLFILYESQLFALNTIDGSVKWKQYLGGGVSSPTILNNVVYAAIVTGTLYAIDSRTGSINWRSDNGANSDGSPIIEGNTIYVKSSENNRGYLHALNLVDGQRKWTHSHRVNSALCSPIIFHGNVYLGISGSFLTVDANTGQTAWEFHNDSDFEAVVASPCIVDNDERVYYSGKSGSKQ